MTRHPTVQAHQTAELRRDAKAAVDALIDRVLAIQTRRGEWQRGYPGGAPGAATVTDPMAEHVAATVTPWRTDSDGTPIIDPTTGHPIRRRPETDPGLDATRWCDEFAELLHRLWDLERRGSTLVPRCSQPGCRTTADGGIWCTRHRPADRTPTPTAPCDCCGEPVEANSDNPNDRGRRGLDYRCYQSWRRAEKRLIEYGDWRTQRRMMLGIDIHQPGRAS